ncbi:MAG TPA: 3-phosphoshikimate 1-carboxyvinyltransferase [Moorella mulderi]|nr:3-phosphoshikimate 1-carboxyvinyltransferase [Moorella mulderi]
MLVIKPPPVLEGIIKPPGDKSISHRAAIIGALASGTSYIEGFLESADTLSTLKCMKALGAEIEGPQEGRLVIKGQGLQGLREPEDVLDAGNAGTTMRLLLGVLAGQPFYSVITGDQSLRRRPMGRVTRPLQQMGAQVWGRQDGELPPLSLRGGRLKGIQYTLPVASAQVKSALLLAGLFASGPTTVIEPIPSRDHTERMLKAAGAPITRQDNAITIEGACRLCPLSLEVPGDISSAAFFLVAGCIHPRARIQLLGVNLNPTRAGILEVLEKMGAEIKIKNIRESSGEEIGDLEVSSSALEGVEIGGSLIPRLIDEIPVLVVAASVARGRTVIRDAAELRVKESNRIDLLALELNKMGAQVYPQPDGFIVEGSGGEPLKGAEVDSHGDHRLGMALAVASLVARGESTILNSRCIGVSYPAFPRDLARLGVEVREGN